MTTNPIIDVEALKTKETLTNSDYILLLVEICTNARRYKIHFSHTSKNFWDEVMSKQVLGKVLGIFKSETLRKYWRIIREVSTKQGFLHFIKQNEDIINNPSMKLLPMINAISTFLKANNSDKDKPISKESFKEFLSKKQNVNVVSTVNTPITSVQKESDDELLKKKRNKDEVEDDKDNNNKSIDKQSTDEKNVISKEKVIENKDDPLELLRQLEERKEDMNEIISVFIQNFPKKKKDDVVSALYKTSGNLQHAYLYLLDPDKYDKYAFVNTDDYIIQNLKGKPYYDQLVSTKGIDLVKEREKFLQAQSN